MTPTQPWFERKFQFDLPVSMFANIVERLRGTPARLEDRVGALPASVLVARWSGKWSIQENVGHLCDLEPLWTRRARELLDGKDQLAVADLTNRATDEARHNERPVGDLLKRFRTLRLELVSTLEHAEETALVRAARHPRLGTLMRLIDVAFFTAEHDDHHLARITELMRLSEAAAG